MTTFLLTLGFDTTAITKCLVKENVKENDKVIILRPSGEKDDRGKQAIKDIEDFLSKIGNVELITKNFHPATPFKAAAEIISLINNMEEDNVVGITGGSREIILPFLIGIISKTRKINEFYMFSDIDRRLRRYDLPNLLFNPDKKDLSILLSTKKYKRMHILAENLDMSQSTISRRCSKLKENKLLKSKRKGKNKMFKITKYGKVILEIHKK